MDASPEARRPRGEDTAVAGTLLQGYSSKSTVSAFGQPNLNFCVCATVRIHADRCPPDFQDCPLLLRLDRTADGPLPANSGRPGGVTAAGAAVDFLKVGLLREDQGIVYLDPEVSDRALQLRVAE